MAVIIAELPAEVAAACMAVLDQLARLLEEAGDPRPTHELRTELYAALFLCAGDPGRPSVSSDGCDCSVLDRPEPTDGYEPTRPQQRFVRTRDRTCRFPTCGQRVGWADADHVVPHGHGGTTDCANLCCLCRSQHRLKTFARGWRFTMDPDGTLTVTTPSGTTRSTRPPGMRPPPAAPDPPPADAAPRLEPDDDPPPF